MEPQTEHDTSADTQPLDFRALDSEPYYTVCPSCLEWTEFIYLGVQRWPEAIAAQHDLPTALMLYNCTCCQTTISQPAPDGVPEKATSLFGIR
jgi:hypothetical protein